MRQKHATCDKIALCKRAYLLLLHAIARKLIDFNFLAIAYYSRMSHK